MISIERCSLEISIHALLAESDLQDSLLVQGHRSHFYPRSPCGERRGPAGGRTNSTPDFYPRSPCGERPEVSDRVPLAEYFYPRSPCGERQYVYVWYTILVNFYPRSPCGERLHLFASSGVDFAISIHALLAESDVVIMLYDSSALIFLSTLSLRRATSRAANCQQRSHQISIHALLAESDGRHSAYCQAMQVFLSTLSLRRATRRKQPSSGFDIHFYPRSPCGERQIVHQ